MSSETRASRVCWSHAASVADILLALDRGCRATRARDARALAQLERATVTSFAIGGVRSA